MEFLFYISTGLFLGWSLGSNNMSNMFGSALGMRMVSLRIARILAFVFVILGACLSGQGTTHTLQQLGAIQQLPIAFMVALSAGLTLFFMSRVGMPVSATQAIVGAWLGWCVYAQKDISIPLVGKIVASWFISPLIAAVIAFVLAWSLRTFLRAHPVSLLYRDAYTRVGLILAGAASAYAVGANSIANVMAPFVKAVNLSDWVIGGWVISAHQQLCFLCALSMALGTWTFSRRVSYTIGKGLARLSAIEAFVTVCTHALVLFLFSSVALRGLLHACHFVSVPLVPIASPGAMIGALIGVSLLKKGTGLRYSVLGKIGVVWLIAPVLSGSVCLCILSIMNLA